MQWNTLVLILLLPIAGIHILPLSCLGFQRGPGRTLFTGFLYKGRSIMLGSRGLRRYARADTGETSLMGLSKVAIEKGRAQLEGVALSMIERVEVGERGGPLRRWDMSRRGRTAVAVEREG